LTTPQYAALSAIEAAPGLSGAALARGTFVTAQTMNEIVTLVVRNGLVERHRHPEHGRIVQLYLTSTGVTILQAAHKVITHVEAQMVAQLTAAQQQDLIGWLRTCSAALEQVAAESIDAHAQQIAIWSPHTPRVRRRVDARNRADVDHASTSISHAAFFLKHL
jgi:DNA-binding MarR family transcriptional regulator